MQCTFFLLPFFTAWPVYEEKVHLSSSQDAFTFTVDVFADVDLPADLLLFGMTTW